MANKKEQRASQLALEAIKDLLINNLLPDRRLIPLTSRAHLFTKPPLADSHITIDVAVLMYFEDELKRCVESVVAALESGVKAMVDYFKRLCLSIAAELLQSKPEQEARLLQLIVGRLADPSSGICSKAMEHLKQLLLLHPVMKVVVIREIRQLIYKPQAKIKTIFNGVLLLGQLQLLSSDHAPALQLVECYMSLFEKAIQQGEMGSRLLAALLAGMNKAFPLLEDISSIHKYVDSLFRMVHTASFTTATQALTLLSHLAVGRPQSKKELSRKGVEGGSKALSNGQNKSFDITRRYYRALYAKLLSDDVSRVSMYSQ